MPGCRAARRRARRGWARTDRRIAAHERARPARGVAAWLVSGEAAASSALFGESAELSTVLSTAAWLPAAVWPPVLEVPALEAPAAELPDGPAWSAAPE